MEFSIGKHSMAGAILSAPGAAGTRRRNRIPAGRPGLRGCLRFPTSPSFVTGKWGCAMFKQICFFRKRPDMTLEEFREYYENQHSQLGKKIGKPAIPNAVRYVRRYLTPVMNPVTGEIHDPGYDCVM